MNRPAGRKRSSKKPAASGPAAPATPAANGVAVGDPPTPGAATPTPTPPTLGGPSPAAPPASSTPDWVKRLARGGVALSAEGISMINSMKGQKTQKSMGTFLTCLSQATGGDKDALGVMCVPRIAHVKDGEFLVGRLVSSEKDPGGTPTVNWWWTISDGHTSAKVRISVADVQKFSEVPLGSMLSFMVGPKCKRTANVKVSSFDLNNATAFRILNPPGEQPEKPAAAPKAVTRPEQQQQQQQATPQPVAAPAAAAADKGPSRKGKPTKEVGKDARPVGVVPVPELPQQPAAASAAAPVQVNGGSSKWGAGQDTPTPPAPSPGEGQNKRKNKKDKSKQREALPRPQQPLPQQQQQRAEVPEQPLEEIPHTPTPAIVPQAAGVVAATTEVSQPTFVRRPSASPVRENGAAYRTATPAAPPQMIELHNKPPVSSPAGDSIWSTQDVGNQHKFLSSSTHASWGTPPKHSSSSSSAADISPAAPQAYYGGATMPTNWMHHQQQQQQVVNGASSSSSYSGRSSPVPMSPLHHHQQQQQPQLLHYLHLQQQQQQQPAPHQLPHQLQVVQHMPTPHFHRDYKIVATIMNIRFVSPGDLPTASFFLQDETHGTHATATQELFSSLLQLPLTAEERLIHKAFIELQNRMIGWRAICQVQEAMPPGSGSLLIMNIEPMTTIAEIVRSGPNMSLDPTGQY